MCRHAAGYATSIPTAPVDEERTSIMRNSYTMPEVFELGRTKDEILGTKPMAIDVDSVLGFGYRVDPLSDDIDENDD